MAWDASLLVEEDEPKSGWDPSLLVEEEPDPAVQPQPEPNLSAPIDFTVPARSSEELAARNLQAEKAIQQQFPGYSASGKEQFQKGVPVFKIIPELTPEEQELLKQASPDEQRAAGYAQGAAQAINSLTTPENLTLLGATAGFGAVPGIARGLALGFAASMAKHTPELATELGLEYGKPKEQRDEQKIGQLISQGAVQTGFIAGLGKAGLSPKAIKPGTVEAPAERVAVEPQERSVIERTPDASQIRSPEEVLPDVPASAKEVAQEVPAKTGAERVPALTQEAAPAEVLLEEKAPAPATTEVEALPSPASSESIGPGAASPIEFAQRSKPVTIEEAPKVFKEPPISEPPSGTPISSPSPNVEVVRSNKDYNLFNNINSSQWSFYFGKLGESAKSAIERIFTGEFRMRENINKDTRVYVDRTLGSLPRQFSKQGGKAFFDLVNGRKMEDIRAEFEGKPGGEKVLAATEQLKTRLEEIRTTIRDTKRESYNAYLNSLDKPVLDELFVKNMGEGVDVSRFTKPQMADALTLSSLPDDWGIADGTYLPHLFFGNYKVTAGEGAFVTRAKTLAEAKAKIYQLTKNNPELARSAFKVEQDTVVPADMIRLGDKNFWRMVSQMKESLGVSAAEVKEAQSGIIGRKASKQKWFGSLQERQGFEGYSKDFKQVMTAYLNGFHRWKELSAMQRDVQPMIEKVRAEGRPNAANRLDEIMENLWGKPAKSTVEFDAFVRQIPGVRDWIKPLALDRWSRNVRSLVSLLTLTTARRAVVNRLQPLQGLYPLVGERLFAKGKILQHTAEGKALLEEGGVRFDAGQYSEPGAKTKLSDFQEKISGEIGNQEQAFLSMFLHGQEQGMSRSQAIQYAKLRGQLMTQFTPLVSDVPKLLSGPFGQLAFQFKRFPIKQVELAAQMVRERNFGGLTRMLGVFAVMGGASFYMRQLMLDKERQLRMRRALEAELGKKGADIAMYGLPGLLGADLSGSLVLGDEPFGENIYEKAGRQVAGPAVTLAYETGKNILKTSRQQMTGMEKTKAIIRRIPSLKPFAELADLESGNTDVLTPDGEIKYRRAISDAIAGLGSFRSANEANKQLAINGIIELKKETQALKNDVFMSLNSDPSKALDAVKAFNARWPEAAITADELTGYLKRRQTGSVKTDEERTAGRKFRSLIE